MYHSRMMLSRRKRAADSRPCEAFPAHGEGGPLAVDEVFLGNLTGKDLISLAALDSFPARGEAKGGFLIALNR